MGRALNKTRQSMIDEVYPRVQIPEDKITEENNLEPASLFSFKPDKIILEIGFGNGEHLTGLIKQHKDQNIKAAFIGAEPFINGMTAFLRDVTEESYENDVCVWNDDAIPVVKSLTAHSIDEIYVLNPDPWHKKRHHDRRIINHDNLSLFSKILKPSGKLTMSTDVPDLADWMVTRAATHDDYEWTANKASDWRIPPKDWIPTRYETKKAKGADKMNYLFFVKNN